MYVRVAQEPAMESRRSAAARNDTARVKLSRSGVERSERAIGAVTWGNLLTGDPAEQRSVPTNRLVGGKDDRGTELARRLNQTRTNSETGEGKAGGQTVDAGPLHRRELVTRGLPLHAEGRRTWRGRTRRGAVRGAAGRQPPVAPRPRQVRALLGAAGEAGPHPEGRGVGHPTDRHSNLRGQGPPACGRDGDRGGLRAGVLRLLVRLSARSLRAPSGGSGPEHGVADAGRMARRGRYQEVFRHRCACPPPGDPWPTDR